MWTDADEAATYSPLHELGLGVYLAHSQAKALLPNDYELSDDIDPVPELEDRTPLQLLTEAEALTRPLAMYHLPSTARTWSSTCATSSGKPAALATDPRLTYADFDDELFGMDQIPMSTRDMRSVGEMLFDVDYLARQLLMDVNGDDAGTLLRSWPTMVAAAAVLWASLPARRPGADEPDHVHHPPLRPGRDHRAQPVRPESVAGSRPDRPRIDQMTQTLSTPRPWCAATAPISPTSTPRHTATSRLPGPGSCTAST